MCVVSISTLELTAHSPYSNCDIYRHHSQYGRCIFVFREYVFALTTPFDAADAITPSEAAPTAPIIAAPPIYPNTIAIIDAKTAAVVAFPHEIFFDFAPRYVYAGAAFKKLFF